MLVRALTAMLVPGARDRFLSAPMTCCRLALSDGVRASVLVPISIAGLMVGSDGLELGRGGGEAVAQGGQVDQERLLDLQ